MAGSDKLELFLRNSRKPPASAYTSVALEIQPKLNPNKTLKIAKIYHKSRYTKHLKSTQEQLSDNAI